MDGDQYVSPIPEDAQEVILETYETGAKHTATYHVAGKEIGVRHWSPSGVLEFEGGLRNGVRHGLCRRWYDNGQLQEVSTYIDGKEHGETRQYNWEGVQIGSYVLDHGTGLDLWYSAPGVLSEERELRDQDRHGFERWWYGDNRRVWEESHFQNGIEHGIFRRWNDQDKLSRGYPRYFIHGERVTKRQYVAACRTDPTLPPFVEADNQPFRSLPQALR